MKTAIERAALKMLLALPQRCHSALVARYAPQAMALGVHPDFSLMLAAEALTGSATVDELGQAKGIEAARRAYGRLMRIGAPAAPKSLVERREMALGVDGTIEARLYSPKSADVSEKLLVYFHGGGCVVGTLADYDRWCDFVADRTGLPVLSVAYRLAPEHPYPAAADDSVAAVRDVLSGRPLGPVKKVALGGDSAGGNMALYAAHEVISSGSHLAALWLLNPGLHTHADYPAQKTYGTGCGFTEDMRAWFEELYMPDRALASEAKASPLFLDDLHILPPTYLCVGGADILQDQAKLFAQKLLDASVPHVFRLEPGMIHNYPVLGGLVADASRAAEAAADWLRAQMDLD